MKVSLVVYEALFDSKDSKGMKTKPKLLIADRKLYMHGFTHMLDPMNQLFTVHFVR